MTWIKKFMDKAPLLFSLLIMAVVSYATEIHLEPLFTGFLDKQSAAYLTGILEQGICSLLMVLFLAKLGMLKSAGFTKPKEWKQVWLTWPLLILSVLNGLSLFTGEIVLDTSNALLLVLFFFLFVSVGFVEEILFRGVILNVLLRKWGSTKKGIMRSVIVSSLIFGVLHLLNFVTGRYELLPTLTQIAYGFFFGVFFAACFIRTRTIWPVIVLHTLFDICGNFPEIAVNSNFGQVVQSSPQGALIAFVCTLPLLIYGLVILRKVKPEMILGDSVSAAVAM